MLKRLWIENVALVEKMELAFSPGLNVITGETGAGKSILIGAIGLALGDRARGDVAGEAKAVVEATLEHAGEVKTLKREVRPDGRTKAWIDGAPTTIGALRDEGGRWVELTAQREGASLLDSDTHITHLDRYAGLENDVEKLAIFHARWQALLSQKQATEMKLQRMQESDELARFQLEEIEAFDPHPGEDDELETEIRLLEGAETLIQGLGIAVDTLDQGEAPVSDRIAEVVETLKRLERIDDSLEAVTTLLEDQLDNLRTAAMDLAQRADEVQLDPERLEDLRSRHSQLMRLIRKYGGSLGSLLEKREQLQNREQSGEDLKRVLAELDRQLAAHLREWEVLLLAVSRKRHEKSGEFEEVLEQGLRSVGVEHPRFVLGWRDEAGDLVSLPESGEHRVTPLGIDPMEFRISFNPGFEPRPLQEVASGGELSRVMLLLKGLEPAGRTPSVLVFDEIDTGISGRTARKVGQRLKELAAHRQVLLVTHLPQIASLADHHIVVEKRSDSTSTRVTMREVVMGGEEQVEEVARLVGGEQVTQTARATAKELIQQR